MTIAQVIDNVRALKTGYDIDEEKLVRFINQVEMLIINDVVKNREGDNDIVSVYGNYDLTSDRDKPLLVPPPYDGMYEYFCAAQIDLMYEDSERYINDSIVYNETFANFKKWWWQTHRQKKRFQFHI